MALWGLWVIVAIAAAAGLVFGIYPELDIFVSSLFFNEAAEKFVSKSDPLLSVLRHVFMLVLVPVVLTSLFALVGKLALPSRPILIPGKVAMFLLITLVLGPGLLINGILKPNSGRPRPLTVVEFNGYEKFQPWYSFRGSCTRNCSFASGEASGAFWTLAPAALVPAPYRYAAIGAAVAYGTAIGIMRIAFGAHFLSDVIFAGLLTALIVWVAHGFFFRWRTAALSEAAVEERMGRIGFAAYAAVDRRIIEFRARLRRLFAPSAASSGTAPSSGP
jgi:lipid A 4'-phosphatase